MNYRVKIANSDVAKFFKQGSVIDSFFVEKGVPADAELTGIQFGKDISSFVFQSGASTASTHITLSWTGPKDGVETMAEPACPEENESQEQEKGVALGFEPDITQDIDPLAQGGVWPAIMEDDEG